MVRTDGAQAGDFVTARALTQEAAAGQKATGDVRGLANSLNLLGVVAVGEEDYEQAKASYEQSRSIREQEGDEIGLQASLHNLGLLAIEQGDYRKHDSERQIANGLTDLGFAMLGLARHDEARPVLEEALRNCSDLGWKENMAYCFVGLAAVSIESGDLERVGRILGQAERLGEQIHLKLERYAEATRERSAQELKSRLGDARFAACREEGRSMPLEDAVALAVKGER